MAEDHTEAIGSRLERLRTAKAWGSLLSAQEFAVITGAGFDPVGQVLGTAVAHLATSARQAGVLVPRQIRCGPTSPQP